MDGIDHFCALYNYKAQTISCIEKPSWNKCFTHLTLRLKVTECMASSSSNFLPTLLHVKYTIKIHYPFI